MTETAPMGTQEITVVSAAPMSHQSAIPNCAQSGMRGRRGQLATSHVETEQGHVIAIAPMGAWEKWDATEIRTRPNLATPVPVVSRFTIIHY